MIYKSHIAFSHNKPFVTGLIITILTFLLLFYEGMDNFDRPEDWLVFMVPIYAVLSGLSFLILKLFFFKWIDEEKWNIINDVLYFIGVLCIALLLIYIFNFCYDYYFGTAYNVLILEKKGRLFFYLLFIGVINFGIIKLLDFYFGLKGKFKKSINLKTEKLYFKGKNKDDILIVETSNFIMAESLGNYVQIYFFNEFNKVEKSVLRNSLSEIENQVLNHKSIQKVYRSHIVNLDKISRLDYKKRKSFIKLEYIEDLVPVSKDVFQDLITQFNSV